MSDLRQFLIFALDDQRYALHLDAVVRAVRVVEFTATPKNSELLLGLINVQGHIVPVFNGRKRWQLPEREIDLNDYLIIGRSKQQMVGLVVNDVQGIVECTANAISSERSLSSFEYIEGVAKLEDGIVLILDMDKFLSAQEAQVATEEIAH